MVEYSKGRKRHSKLENSKLSVKHTGKNKEKLVSKIEYRKLEHKFEI